MIILINNTHHEILNNDSFAPIKYTAITRIQETIHNLVEHLKHDNNILTRENSQIINTVHSSNSDTTHNPNTTNNSNISSNNSITTINSNTSHNNYNTANNSNTTHSHSHTTNSQNDTNSSGILNRPSLRDRRKKHTAHNPDQCHNPSCLTCAELNIVNLSSLTLSRAQRILLNRGLSFVPTAPNATTTELLNDFHQFTARTKRQLYRIAKPPKRTGERTLYRKPPPDKIHSKTYELGPNNNHQYTQSTTLTTWTDPQQPNVNQYMFTGNTQDPIIQIVQPTTSRLTTTIFTTNNSAIINHT